MAKHLFQKGESHGNTVISPSCIQWAKANGHASWADETESIIQAYKEWQVANSRVVNLSYMKEGNR